MKYILFFLLLLFTKIIFSQNYFPSYYDTTYTKGEILLEGKVDLLSNSLTNDIVNKLRYGRTINDDDINSSLSKHKESSRIQLETNSEIEYRNYQIFPESKWGILIKTGVFLSGSSIYSKDFAQLSMFGKTPDLGGALNLSPTIFSSTTYSKLGIGMINKKTKNSISLTFFEILNHTQSTLLNGKLNLDNIGNTIAIQDLDYQYSSYEKTKETHNWGIGIDLDLKIPITTFFDKVITLQIMTKNIGVGILTKQIQNYEIDSSYHFSGLELQHLSTLSKLSGDYLLDSLSIKKSTDYQLIALPGYLQAGKINLSSSDKRLQTYYGCRIYPNFAFIPFFYSGISYNLNSYLRVGISENFGITKQLRTGVFLQARNKNITFSIGSENVFNSFRKDGKGRSFQFKLACNY